MINKYKQIVNNRFVINKINLNVIIKQLWFKLNNIYYFTLSDQSVNKETVIYNREHSTKYFSELWILIHRTSLTTLRDHVSNW